MTTDNQPALPELPEPEELWLPTHTMEYYTADQMRAYAIESLRRAEGATLGEGRELRPDYANALPGGRLDLSTFQEIEDALDAIEAPMQADGKWLTLAERIKAMQSAPERGGWISADDVRRHVRTIDVALNGEEGAAKQASLCDIASQVAHECRTGGPILARATLTAQRVAYEDVKCNHTWPAKRVGDVCRDCYSAAQRVAAGDEDDSWDLYVDPKPDLSGMAGVEILHMILDGRISGRISEWPQLKPAIESVLKALTPPPTGEAVAWVDPADPMFRDDWVSTTPILHRKEHAKGLVPLYTHPAAQADGRGVDDAMHWIDRYATGIDDELQMDRVVEALSGGAKPNADYALVPRKLPLGLWLDSHKPSINHPGNWQDYYQKWWDNLTAALTAPADVEDV